MKGEEKLSKIWGFISKHEEIFIVVAFILFYLSIATLMGNLRPFAAVSSESMLPTLQKGDLILVQGSSISILDVGDIVIYDVPSPFDRYVLSPIIHRIIEKGIEDGKVYYITQGDNNLGPDIWRVPIEKIIGKYTGIRIPLLGQVLLFIRTPLGFASIIIIIVTLFLYSYHTSKKEIPQKQC